MVVLVVGVSHTTLFPHETSQEPKSQQQQQQQESSNVLEKIPSALENHKQKQVPNVQLQINNVKNNNRVQPEPPVPALKQLKKPKPSYDVHIFYYPWYANPKHDKRYLHWNHQYLPHWSPDIAKLYPQGAHKPPDDIGANFYPALGAYR